MPECEFLLALYSVASSGTSAPTDAHEDVEEPDRRLGPLPRQQEAGDLTAELGDAAQPGIEVMGAEMLLPKCL